MEFQTPYTQFGMIVYFNALEKQAVAMLPLVFLIKKNLI